MMPFLFKYNNEIINPVAMYDELESPNKVALMYVSDYGYATPKDAWLYQLSAYNTLTIIANNWLYRGYYDWTITRNSEESRVFQVSTYGATGASLTSHALGVRPVFYLKKEVTINPSLHTGSKIDPFRIVS